MRLSRREIALAIGCALAFFACACAAELWLGRFATSAIAAGLVLVLVAGAIVLYRHIEDRAEAERQQVVAAGALVEAVRPRLPLPPLGGFALPPDSALLLYSLVRSVGPKRVVETGSGVSTLLIGYALKAAGKGHLTSLELDPRYAARTRAEVERHGLDEWVRVVDAPLTELTVEGERLRWHDPHALETLSEIDLVFDDGPPRNLGANLRAAALPLFWPRLSSEAVYCVSFIAAEERANIARWLLRHPELEAETIRTKKGNVILRRRIRSES